MKKLFLFSAVTAGLFTSCVQNDLIVPELSEAEKEITFQTVVEKQHTRAIITGVDYDENCPSFGTYAFVNRTSTTLPGNERYITDAEIVHYNEGGTHFWAPKGTQTGDEDRNEKYLWPETGSLTFYSYSPYYYQESGSSTTKLNPSVPQIGEKGFVFSGYNVDQHQETDLMVAEIKYGQTANIQHGGINVDGTASLVKHTGVPTIFKHKLALIGGFILSTSDDYDGVYDGANDNTASKGNMRFRILSIGFNNIPTVGTFTSEGVVGTNGDIIAEKWEMSSSVETKDYVWYKSPTYVVDDNDQTQDQIEGVEFGHVESKQLHIYNSEGDQGHRRIAPTILNGYLLAIPQTFEINTGENIPELEVHYTVETYDGTKWTGAEDASKIIKRTVSLADIHASDPDKGWGIGKKILYKLEFATTEIHWAPSVVEWIVNDVPFDY